MKKGFLNEDERTFLKVCLDYSRKDSKLTWTIIKDETGFYGRKVDRLIKFFLEREFIIKEGSYYTVNKSKENKILESLEYNQKEDNKLYAFIDYLKKKAPQLIICFLVVALIWSNMFNLREQTGIHPTTIIAGTCGDSNSNPLDNKTINWTKAMEGGEHIEYENYVVLILNDSFYEE